jgi:acyl-CoA reductase-like NAD-dependent aldehyde dehydrogenase
MKKENTNYHNILPKNISHYINGEFIYTSSLSSIKSPSEKIEEENKYFIPETILVINPTTEEKICEFREAGFFEIELAYKSSVKAQILWEKFHLIKK